MLDKAFDLIEGHPSFWAIRHWFISGRNSPRRVRLLRMTINFDMNLRLRTLGNGLNVPA